MQPDDASRSRSDGFAWSEAKRIFSEAVEQALAERAAFVAAACGGNASLHHEVSSLLESHGQSESFFEQPLASSLVPADPMIGRRIGPYQILQRVAVGGMGAVYLAERADDQFRKRVALKTVRPELFNEQALRRFQNERQTLAVLDHPNIIRLLDGGTTEEGVPYLVTEYVEGLPIDRHCTAGKLKVAERLALFRSVLGAVHYAHQNLVVHRDLKPNNILVTPEGVPKLLDFGIAKLLRPEYSAQPSGLTRPDMQAMTPDFASPEQVLGQPITTASDIYSLGVILYGLLTGHHPFESQMHTAFELSHAICETDPERPSRIAEGIELRERGEARSLRGDLDTIVLMAMRREPRHRYASAEHFSEDIRRHLEGFPVAARQAGIWYKASKFVKRHKVSTVGAAVLIAALAVSTALAVEQYRTAARRFQDLRQFAGFVLTDLDDALREGETPARKKMTEKGLEYLDRLAKEKAGDPSIMRDLVKGYIRNGDAKGNLYGATSGDFVAGQESYRKALAIAEELVRSEPANLEDRRDLVTALLRLGEALAGAGNRTEAARQYDEAQRVLAAHQETGTPSESALLQTVSLWTDMGSKQALLSDPAGALECYRRALQTAERFPPTFANKANLIAYAREQTAINAALAGSTTGAEETLRESIATYKLRKPTPRALRTLAKAYKNLAAVQLMTGRASDALASIRESLRLSEGLLSADQKNAEYRIDREQALMTEIEALAANGLSAEEKGETVRALQIMKSMADQHDATYQAAADYAELLATSPFPDVRNPVMALQYARQAAAMTKDTDPEVLHVLALAYEGAGDRQRALEAADKALSLVPEGRPSVFSRKLQAEVTRLAR